jgi:hypothetical protein
MRNSHLLSACALVLLSSVSTISSASIIYSVDRTIGAGTVTGTIETTGKQGVLSDADIMNVSLTVSAPDLPGSPESLTIPGIFGNAVTATDTQLLFDFAASGDNYFWVQGLGSPPVTNGVVWHLETGGFSAVGFGEHITYIGEAPEGAEITIQSVNPSPSGTVVFAEVATVPVPAAVWLFGSGLIGLVGLARRKKA